MRAEPLLHEIGEAVAVAVLEAVPDPVVVAVRVPRRRGGPEVGDVPQPVPVGILALVGDAVAVGVDASRMGPGALLLEVGQAVAVGVLASVPEAVTVRVPAPRVRPGQVLVAVPQSVAVGVLDRVGDPVAVRVPAERAGERPLPLEPVREAVVVRVPGTRRDGRHRREAGDGEQHRGAPHHASASTDQSPHGHPRMDGRGHLSSDARRPRPCPRIWPLGARRSMTRASWSGVARHRTACRCGTATGRPSAASEVRAGRASRATMPTPMAVSMATWITGRRRLTIAPPAPHDRRLGGLVLVGPQQAPVAQVGQALEAVQQRLGPARPRAGPRRGPTATAAGRARSRPGR